MISSTDSPSKVAILGAGMAGYGAAHQLHQDGIPSVTYEKRNQYGGHTSSFVTPSGFVFDEGPHISFTKDAGMQEFLASAVDDEYEILQAEVNNYWRGHWIKHPAQSNLHGLPEDLLVPLLKDYFEAYYAETPRDSITTFADWLIASYGETFAEMFPMVYGKKYHTTEASNMSTSWLGPRLHTPEPEELLRGLLSPATDDVHYISHFRYPTHGGFHSYLRQFPSYTTIKTNHRVVGIDPRERVITFANGTKVCHEKIISSIPLPSLIPMIDGVPDDVRDAAGRLACTACVIVSLGVDRADLSDAHWSYFYDEDVSFARVHYPHMLSSNNAPEGKGSIQAEVYFSEKYKPLRQSPESLIPVVIDDLIRTGILQEEDTIIDTHAMLIPYANVIFDLECADALDTVHGYLADVDIAYCGRYGEWAYIWTDESFRSGEEAAKRVHDGVLI